MLPETCYRHVEGILFLDNLRVELQKNTWILLINIAKRHFKRLFSTPDVCCFLVLLVSKIWVLAKYYCFCLSVVTLFSFYVTLYQFGKSQFSEYGV